MSAKRERIFRYVAHAEIEKYLADGWIVVSTLGQPHSSYSVLMEEIQSEDMCDSDIMNDEVGDDES